MSVLLPMAMLSENKEQPHAGGAVYGKNGDDMRTAPTYGGHTGHVLPDEMINNVDHLGEHSPSTSLTTTHSSSEEQPRAGRCTGEAALWDLACASRVSGTLCLCPHWDLLS